MNGRSFSRPPFGGGFGGGFESPFGPAPKDFYALVAIVFVTFSMRYLGPAAIVPRLLDLGRGVWEYGLLWQLVTYPFSGYGAPSLWILLELLILYWFGRTVRYQLGKKRFWRLLLVTSILAAVAAVAVQLLVLFLAGSIPVTAFTIMQGQRMILAIMIAAFATMNARATILLFFVLPVQARWFLWIEILFAFVAFLGSQDFAGFVGITVAVGLTYGSLRYGGPGKLARRWWLHLRERRLRSQLARERKKRNLRVVRDEEDGGPFVH